MDHGCHVCPTFPLGHKQVEMWSDKDNLSSLEKGGSG